MSVLVTGAAGFIGSHLVERLLDEGVEVVGLDNFDSFYDPMVKERNLGRARGFVRFAEVRGDIRDPEAHQRLPYEIDTVIHLAALAGVRPSIRDPHGYFDVNVRGTLLLPDFMKDRGIPRLLFASSSSVYGNSATVPFREDDAGDRPISPYAATKRAGELIVHAHGHLYGIEPSAYGSSRSTDRGSVRIWPSTPFRVVSLKACPSRCTATGCPSATTPTWTTSWKGESAMRYLARSTGTYEIVNLGGARTITLRDMIVHVATALGVSPQIEKPCEQAGDVRRTFRRRVEGPASLRL